MYGVLAGLQTAPIRPEALMAFYGRGAARRARHSKREIENTWRECPVPGHGGYNPMQKTLGGRYVVGPCPKCAAERYEAAKRGL